MGRCCSGVDERRARVVGRVVLGLWFAAAAFCSGARAGGALAPRGGNARALAPAKEKAA